jgi:hypothetical protein
MFYSSSLKISDLTFRSLFHFELILINVQVFARGLASVFQIGGYPVFPASFVEERVLVNVCFWNLC